MRLTCLVTLIIASATAALSQSANPTFDPVFSSVSFGAFCQQRSVGERIAPDTKAEKIDLLPFTPDIRWPGTRVPALPGISFGVRTETKDGTVLSPVLIEVTHPAFLGSDLTRQSYVTILGGDGASINAYSFDLLEEMVTGQWSLRALHNGQVLYHVTFDVVPAALAPDIGRDCNANYTS